MLHEPKTFGMRVLLFALLCCLCRCAPAQKRVRPISIIPAPVELVRNTGSFVITKSTMLVTSTNDPELLSCAQYFVNSIKLAARFQLKSSSGSQPKSNSIFLHQVPDGQLGNEGYILEVSKDHIEIKGNTRNGIFYGLQTLLQLLPEEITSQLPADTIVWDVPCVTVRDTPRFSWRGMHLDVSRHFFPKEFIKTYIDMLAMHKMNVFHWHLCDDQGWRIEIKKYPKLTGVGAWRVDRELVDWNARQPQQEGEKATYGGYYSQEDIHEIVAYAQDRSITIVPEIEMPAHCTAALAAYPEYSCTGGPFTVPPGGVWPLSDIFCAGNDGTFQFLEQILDEVCTLFPGQYIHVGGDEADKTRWKACPKCQSRIRSENLHSEAELQSYFIRRIETYLQSKKRRLIGWDEILEGGLAPNATVMSWRGMDGGIEAAKQHHDVVMTPGTYCYFDHYQGRSELEPRAIGGYLPLSKVYEFEPVPPSLEFNQIKYILGAQANVWTEYIPTPAHVQYMILPRMAAMAEVLWSPKDARTWPDFAKRLDNLTGRYEVNTYNYARSAYLVAFKPTLDTVDRKVEIGMSTELPLDEIRYTTNLSDPTLSSALYSSPLTVAGTTTYRAVAFMHGKKHGKETERTVYVHKALLKPLQLANPYDQYTAGGPKALVDGLCGSIAYNDGFWQGYRKDDLEATIDLGAATRLTYLESHFLENTIAWIFLPRTVDVSTSTDGSEYTLIATIDMPVPSFHQPVQIKKFKYDFKDVTARYVRLTAKNIGICPDWHGGRGEKAWLFVDEIIVE